MFTNGIFHFLFSLNMSGLSINYYAATLVILQGTVYVSRSHLKALVVELPPS